jgi:Uma2 family endonuclease
LRRESKTTAAIRDRLRIPGSFADFHARLGSISLDRILMKPPPGTATEEDLLTALHTPPHHPCELVDGTLVLKIGSCWSGLFVAALGRKIGNHVEETDAGVCLAGRLAYRLGPGLIRIPSFSFVSWKNLPNGAMPDEEIASFLPSIVVEAPNETNTAAEIRRKVGEYIAAGCKLVWIIDPRTKSATVHTSTACHKELDESGILEGGKALPGFKLPLAELFAVGKRTKKC